MAIQHGLASIACSRLSVIRAKRRVIASEASEGKLRGVLGRRERRLPKTPLNFLLLTLITLMTESLERQRLLNLSSSILDLSHPESKRERTLASSIGSSIYSKQPVDSLNFLNELLLWFWNLRHRQQDVVETRYLQHSFQNIWLPGSVPLGSTMLQKLEL